MIEKIVNVSTGEETIREYTAQEIAEVEKSIAEAALKAEVLSAKEAARKSILDKLGLTLDEAKILLS